MVLSLKSVRKKDVNGIGFSCLVLFMVLMKFYFVRLVNFNN